MTNGNGQAQPLEAVRTGKAKSQFGAPGGPDPAAAGRKAVEVRERNLEQHITKTRQSLIIGAPKALEVIAEAVRGAKRRSDVDWQIRTQNARWWVEQVLGQAQQRIEHSTRDEFTRRVDELLAEMDAESSPATT